MGRDQQELKNAYKSGNEGNERYDHHEALYERITQQTRHRDFNTTNLRVYYSSYNASVGRFKNLAYVIILAKRCTIQSSRNCLFRTLQVATALSRYINRPQKCLRHQSLRPNI